MNIHDCIYNIRCDIIKHELMEKQKGSLKSSFKFLQRLKETPISQELWEREVKYFILDCMDYDYGRFRQYDFQQWDWELAKKLIKMV